jgi:hypothetical protein
LARALRQPVIKILLNGFLMRLAPAETYAPQLPKGFGDDFLTGLPYRTTSLPDDLTSSFPAVNLNPSFGSF